MLYEYINLHNGILITAALIALVAVVGLIRIYVFNREPDQLSTLMTFSSQANNSSAVFGGKGTLDVSGQTTDSNFDKTVDDLNSRLKTRVKGPKLTLDELLFRAGMFTEAEKAVFYKFKLISNIGGFITSIIIGIYFGFPPMLFLAFLIIGTMVGYQLPYSWLDRKIEHRNEEIMFYLPLVIEQISIGVSSSLDIGPCIQQVVQMADERDSHNPVTELLRFAQNYIKSGVPFEEAMTETGKAAGHTELKHAFMYLAQVAKHGGEITRQLQELADSVSAQRQAHIEGRIKKLELVATGPVCLVFFGFLIILLVSFGMKISKAL